MNTQNSKIVGEGLTYDDVLLVPAFSEVLPREVSIQTKFTRNITINVPIVSAAMDTVTESAMAIAMAREGGIGVLHKNMSAEQQAKEVRKVKRAESVKDAEKILQQHKIEKLLIVEGKKLEGLITFRDITKVTQKPIANKDSFGRLRVAAAIGVTPDAIDRAEALINAGVDALIIDTAHGHTKGVVNVLKEIKKKFKDIDVVVGNIATPEAAKYLVEAGADAVKVGIGPGSICTTRIVAGVGFPQFSAVLDVAEAIKGSGVPVIADGGIRYTGDIPKAIAAGADTVMLGSLLAGTKESPGETIIYEGRKFKSYRGMGSVEAMKQGSKDRYFQDVEDDIKKLVPEGIVGRVPYKGDLFESVHQFIGGLRAGMGYCGAKDVETLKNTGRFVKITASGINESHPHDVMITKESPNYSRR
ncbi:UNVERIFIED_CONTAM: hypothetical protein GTU68_039741 [Idotea baltica]|nr:hypothetical protein [Idotea baltica]